HRRLRRALHDLAPAAPGQTDAQLLRGWTTSRRSPRRRLPPLGCALACALVCTAAVSCTSRRGEVALAAQQTLVGLPVEQLLACAGPPDATAQAGEREYLTYETFDGYLASPGLSV